MTILARLASRSIATARMLAILFMGFASGLPLALTGSTLSIWLEEAGMSLTAIGLFALVGISYNAQIPVGAARSTAWRCRS